MPSNQNEWLSINIITILLQETCLRTYPPTTPKIYHWMLKNEPSAQAQYSALFMLSLLSRDQKLSSESFIKALATFLIKIVIYFFREIDLASTRLASFWFIIFLSYHHFMEKFEIHFFVNSSWYTAFTWNRFTWFFLYNSQRSSPTILHEIN